jgi:hypothetical protein
VQISSRKRVTSATELSQKDRMQLIDDSRNVSDYLCSPSIRCLRHSLRSRVLRSIAGAGLLNIRTLKLGKSNHDETAASQLQGR